ncbi:MAG: Gfo/Idh/MocA family oxidoreductase [Gammaproteobacteria bacterium]|jgi:predicted dehydrogenase|nr:Gfo/Idh/MocA family oxidoreductase [Gammaproteobacteria bacterium]
MAKTLSNRRIRLGMVGGGQDALIGNAHRIAARLDDEYELCAGALSSNSVRAMSSAQEIGLPADRSYGSYAEMVSSEAAREDGIDVVAIVTPNDTHHAIAKAFLAAGIHVICDKPMTVTIEEAESLQDAARSAGRILAVTYNYTGYAMVREAREIIERGDLGTIRVVQVQYAQDWLTEPIELDGQKQAAWRTDPAKSGVGGTITDIGTHAYHLACFVSGLKLEALCADLTTFVDGRRLDDNAHLLLRFAGGAKGMLWASQVAVGNENNVRLGVYGDKGGLTWQQEQANEISFSLFGKATQRITRGGPSGHPASSTSIIRMPNGHPEGYLEGFATIYSQVAAAIRAASEGKAPDTNILFPTGDDGKAGVAFVDAAVRSSTAGGIWVDL